VWYKNIAGRFVGLVTKHACDRQTDVTDGQNYDSQDCASIAASRVWPQYINVPDRHDRETDRTTVRQHRANRFTNGRPKNFVVIKNQVNVKRHTVGATSSVGISSYWVLLLLQ